MNKGTLALIGISFPIIAFAAGSVKFWADNTYVQHQQLSGILKLSKEEDHKDQLDWLYTLKDAGKLTETDAFKIGFLERKLRK
jgi:hypothetical protein